MQPKTEKQEKRRLSILELTLTTVSPVINLLC